MAKKLPGEQGGAATWGSIRWSFHSLMALLITALMLAVTYLPRKAEMPSSNETSRVAPKYGRVGRARQEGECDLFSGRWVYDNVSYPLYKEKECQFISEMTCEKYGRKDLSYQNWRWQPHDCDLPRFNAIALLERLRNKRMVFVGDSLIRGQWVSMVCLMDSVIPSDSLKSRTYYHNASRVVFKAKEYNASIESYWAPLLVESNCDDPINHNASDPIVRVQAIEKHAQHWSDADILVFDNYLWWRRPQMKVLWGSFKSPDAIYKEVKMPRAYEMGMTTWSQWLEIHVNQSNTELFFVTMSPTHERAEDWGGFTGQNCYQETELITKEDYWGSGSNLAMMRVVETVINDLRARGVTIQVLNITQLSEYRKEAHPAIHRKQYRPLKEEQLANPMSYADCMHWCLPGVPDVWNELLYAHIFKNWVPKLESRVENK
ncbi:protein trichome birefringence-like 34 [Punica granatum]|uniref:Protein trichome birefringence-like 34 n=1 Tax=Punica granatum TaxID=22663 RepID=A0A6P8DQ55_PUNGR|nr:protein trichome birefringence-like 34 [Punica granatum]